MADERVAFALRIAPEVMEAVRRTASADVRSANAQVEVLLLEALRARGVRLRRPADAKKETP